MAKTGHSNRSPLTGEITHYDSHGKKTGTSRPNWGGGYTNYNSFSNYITGRSNTFAFQTAKAVADDPGNVYNPLFIYGNPGLGKTHLLNAIRVRISSLSSDTQIGMVSADELISQMVNAIMAEESVLWRERLLSNDVLLIDDVHALAGKEATQKELVSIARAFAERGKQVVMTSSVPPEALPWLISGIRGFDRSLIADIQPLDTQTAKSIVQDKADRRELRLTEESLEYIATQTGGEVRRIEGIIRRLYAEQNLMCTVIDFSVVKEVCEDYKGLCTL